VQDVERRQLAIENEDAARARRLQWRIFWVALIVRLLAMTLGQTWRIRDFEDHFRFGGEMARISRALVTGYGYADPFMGHTGPSAWSPPLYVLLIAAVFKVFGVYTAVSAWVILALNCVMSAATAIAVYEIGWRCFDRRVALWSGWMWALHPAAMQYAVKWIWEMSATTMLLAWILVLALRMRSVGEAGEGQSWRRWTWFGLLWGLLALTGTTPLILLPAMVVWLLWPQRKRLVVGLAKASLAGVMICAVVAPWAVRNWVVFHRFIPFRSNFGAENYLGNGPWSVGFPWGRTVPLENKRILREYANMGEAAWVADRGAKAQIWIKAHRGRYLQLAVKRAYMYWWSVPHPLAEGALAEYMREISYSFLSLAGGFGRTLVQDRSLDRVDDHGKAVVRNCNGGSIVVHWPWTLPLTRTSRFTMPPWGPVLASAVSPASSSPRRDLPSR